MRELKFNLTVDNSALLNANPVEFYAKAYINEDIANNFRTLPGIKSKTKLATTTFTSILKTSSCDFVAGTENLSAIDIDVQPVSALGQICRFDLEASYLSLAMAKGSGASFEVQPFMNFYWDQMAKEISSEIETIRWQGNTAGTGAGYTGVNAFKVLADGYEKKLAIGVSASTVLSVTASTLTSTNIVAQMALVYNKLATSAPALIGRTEDLRFYVSPFIASLYRQAVASANLMSYVTKNLDLTFLDIKVVISQGLSANKMVLTLKDNLIYAFDGEGDGKALKAINLEESIAEPKLRTRANLKIGFHIVNGLEIVYYA